MPFEKYTLSNFRRVLDDPSLLFDHYSYLKNPSSINKKLNGMLYKYRYPDTHDVMSGDWDNLVILDGCRFDFFQDQNVIDGRLQCVTSKGSHSTEFLKETFVGKQFHDTVYITANPHAPRLITNEFYTMETFYNENSQGLPREHYPGNVIEMARSAAKKHPEKRYIVHFMQPNVPFLGEKADAIRERLFESDNIIFSGMNSQKAPSDSGRYTEVSTLKAACEKGYISRRELIEGYRENVDIAINAASTLISEFDGKSVITADHGEMLGERLPPFYFKQFGHDPYLYSDELRYVPWLTIDSTNRRDTTREDPISREEINEDVVADRLRQLGYVEYAKNSRDQQT